MSLLAPAPHVAPLIETRAVTRVIGGDIPTTLVAGIDFAVQPGEFVAVTGPSGSGKSSLLYLLGLLDKPTTGEVYIDGRATSGLSEDTRAALRLSTLGFVFQFHFLLPEFTALENVMLPMRALGKRSEKEMRARALEILSSLGLADHARKRPDQMSGGQRQRVAIARALANDPLSFSQTNRPAISTRNRARRCSASCESWRTRHATVMARRSSSSPMISTLRRKPTGACISWTGGLRRCEEHMKHERRPPHPSCFACHLLPQGRKTPIWQVRNLLPLRKKVALAQRGSDEGRRRCRLSASPELMSFTQPALRSPPR